MRTQVLDETLYKTATKIILGCGPRSATRNPGWLPTDRYVIDVTNKETLLKWWEPGTITAFLAEHVWEHLTEDEAINANAIIFEFLKPGGWFRVAVPDGYNPDPAHIEHIKVGGDNQYHQQLYNYKSMTSQLEKAGFKIDLIEYYDEHGKFNTTPWDEAKGFVKRTSRTKKRVPSLLIDATKPGVLAVKPPLNITPIIVIP